MINNRQGGRRRGRGGPRPQGLSGRPDGNRQDNRQRGNAAQLLEKYKSMARDAQLAGDRVQTEYYLQFADHYFRVLGESRSRYEEQRRARGDDDEDEDLDDEAMDGSDEETGQFDRQDRPERAERAERSERPERQDRGDRAMQDRSERRRDRGDREGGEGEPRRERYARDDRGERPQRTERPARSERNEARERPANNGQSRVAEDRDEGDQRIAFDILPPAIGISDEPVAVNDEAEEAPRPRRRTRRPKIAEGDGEIAPAA